MKIIEWVHVHAIGIFTIRRNKSVNVIDVLKTLGTRINRWYPKINFGGCCVYASLVGKELQKRGLDVNIIVAAYDASENIDRARKFVNNNKMEEWNTHGIWFNHVGLEIRIGDEIYHHDTNQTKPEGLFLGEWEIYEGRLSVEEAENLASRAEGWNDSFDRRSIPRLRNHIEKFLEATFPIPA